MMQYLRGFIKEIFDNIKPIGNQVMVMLDNNYISKCLSKY